MVSSWKSSRLRKQDSDVCMACHIRREAPSNWADRWSRCSLPAIQASDSSDSPTPNCSSSTSLRTSRLSLAAWVAPAVSPSRQRSTLSAHSANDRHHTSPPAAPRSRQAIRSGNPCDGRRDSPRARPRQDSAHISPLRAPNSRNSASAFSNSGNAVAGSPPNIAMLPSTSGK
jgi:hypothetical protein